MAIRLQGADYRDSSDWPRQHAWLRETLEKLHHVFAPRLKALPPVTVGDGGANGPLSEGAQIAVEDSGTQLEH